jgi:2-keto-4-pentenoate hydratase/2-oxohepta-3-ene-1,7-dioic acid hydratase in catechol pathway
MKIARVRTPKGKTAHAVLRDGKAIVAKGNILARWQETQETYPLSDVRLLAPIEPPNILCFGRNYKAHAEEGGGDIPKAPILFLKSTTSLIGPDDPILIPECAPTQVDYEAELVVVMKKTARNVSEANALDYVLGCTCGHDVSARDCQRNDGQWARAKSFDTFCPIGPWIETGLDPANVRVQGRLNGQVMQDANTSLMIFSVAYLISYLSRGMTLLPGTILMTGTPAGCGFAQNPPRWLKPGDAYEVEIEGIGILRNPVVAEQRQ